MNDGLTPQQRALKAAAKKAEDRQALRELLEGLSLHFPKLVISAALVLQVGPVGFGSWEFHFNGWVYKDRADNEFQFRAKAWRAWAKDEGVEI